MKNEQGTDHTEYIKLGHRRLPRLIFQFIIRRFAVWATDNVGK
jgi:hypothetical protein